MLRIVAIAILLTASPLHAAEFRWLNAWDRKLSFDVGND